MKLVPNSWGVLHEANDCHNPSGPGGGRFCSGNYLQGVHALAQASGVGFTTNPRLSVRQSSFDPYSRKVELGTFRGMDSWGKATAADILSVARHEVGHGLSQDYGKRPAQRILGGRWFSTQYAEEFGAWKAAVQRAPFGRVRWSMVRKSLRGYLHDDAELYRTLAAEIKQKTGLERDLSTEDGPWDKAITARYDALLDHHLSVLKRYGRRVRARARK